ncbi:MAG: ROK family protein [Spirochaetes bacterium]|nr:ROK family protein [Spirochaetota bacterium]
MFAGIDIGGTGIKGVITDANAKIITSSETPTPATAQDIDFAIAGLIECMLKRCNIKPNKLRAIGIGAAGSIDNRNGIAIHSPNIPAWKNYPLAEKIRSLTGTPVVLENDATVATAGAWLQENIIKYSNWIMITLGTGIGGGAVIDNRIYTGQSGSSLEVGHITIDINGRECPCGNRGCLERYASATALVETVKKDLKSFPASSLNNRIKYEKLTSRMIYEEALKKDALALRSINEISTYLGFGIVNIVNILNPQAVVFGGGLSQAYKLIFPVVKEVIKKHAMTGMKEKVKLIPLRNQSRTSAMGAAKMAIERINRNSINTK